MKELNFSNFKFCIVVLVIIPILFLGGCTNLNVNSGSSYYNDNAIAGDDHSNAQSMSTKFENGSFKGQIGKFDGHYKIAEAKINNECNTEFNISFSATSGKAKIVLITPKSHVEVLKEVDHQGEASYEGTVNVQLNPGEYKVKIVGDEYGGEFKIGESQNLFKFRDKIVDDDGFPFTDKKDDKMFDDNFPFENKKDGKMFDDNFPFGNKKEF